MEKKAAHILAIACPAQGHVIPFLNFCNKIAEQGRIKVTFVNTELVHSRIMAAKKNEDDDDDRVRLVSVPDGLHDLNDRMDPLIIFDSLKKVMPDHILDLIHKINQSNDNLPITAVIADLTIGWILDVAEKIGVQNFGFWSSGPASLVNFYETEQNNFPKEMLGLGNNKSDQEKMQKVFSDIAVTSLHTANRAKCTIGNVFYELDPISCDLIPKFLPIGPFKQNSSKYGSFLPQDLSCLNWLDNQQPKSVIYVAFGSTAVLNRNQLEQLALALEQSGRPFLWVIGSQIGRESILPYDDFLARVGNRAKIVEWTSQRKVLAHSAIACFLTHCGWNSALESVSLGVPLLCWPYFADHFQVQSYICDSWKVGLRLDSDENSIRSKEEILGKIEILLSNANFKANSLKLKGLAEKSIRKGGHSFENMQKFIKLLID